MGVKYFETFFQIEPKIVLNLREACAVRFYSVAERIEFIPFEISYCSFAEHRPVLMFCLNQNLKTGEDRRFYPDSEVCTVLVGHFLHGVSVIIQESCNEELLSHFTYFTAHSNEIFTILQDGRSQGRVTPKPFQSVTSPRVKVAAIPFSSLTSDVNHPLTFLFTTAVPEPAAASTIYETATEQYRRRACTGTQTRLPIRGD